ncbi:MAG: glycine cleavage system protein H [Prolixibacteraceae bacterium]
MDGFSYHDIFATKGLEYLVIIAFLILLIPFWIVLNKQSVLRQEIQRAFGVLSAKILKVPQGLLFAGNHTWMYMEKSGSAKIGLDDLLLHLTGKVKFTILKNPGEKINKGELLTEIDQDGKLLHIFSPVSGIIADTNSLLKNEVGALNGDPYGRGWIYKIKPTNWIAETSHCHFADEATDWISRELERFKDFLARSMKNSLPENAMIVMQDGGEILDHSLSAMNDVVWKDFQKEFLNPERLGTPEN